MQMCAPHMFTNGVDLCNRFGVVQSRLAASQRCDFRSEHQDAECSLYVPFEQSVPSGMLRIETLLILFENPQRFGSQHMVHYLFTDIPNRYCLQCGLADI